MSIEGQGHFFIIYFPGFVCFVLYLDKISGERLQDHWSSGIILEPLCSNSRSLMAKLLHCKSSHIFPTREVSMCHSKF